MSTESFGGPDTGSEESELPTSTEEAQGESSESPEEAEEAEQ